MSTTTNYLLQAKEMNELFAKLEKQYAIYAPVKIHAGGRYAQQDSILYKEVHTYEEIEFRGRSTYPAKEVLTPVTETLFYFTEDEYRESKLKDDRELLIFARACDINAIKILDQMYLENGGIEDYFYKRRRDRAKFVLIECTEQFDGCFCASVGANTTDMHSLAVSFRDQEAFVEVRDKAFNDYFENKQISNYHIAFPMENELKVEYPVIDSIEMVNRLKEHPMWDEYDKRCIGCGACTVACSTCTCFTTTDISYSQNAHVGERRRTCASCMVDGFDAMAGDQCFREKTSEKYRYKILHKVYGHDARFHTGPMCVGCGRCTARCPQLISYPETLKKIFDAIEDIQQKEAVLNA